MVDPMDPIAHNVINNLDPKSTAIIRLVCGIRNDLGRTYSLPAVLRPAFDWPTPPTPLTVCVRLRYYLLRQYLHALRVHKF
jgi:hypothetical protein